jgi:hypothetical protein
MIRKEENETETKHTYVFITVTLLYRRLSLVEYQDIKAKAKHSHYTPGVAQRFPGI